MAASPKHLYWDSCAWLGLLNGEPDKQRELAIIYDSAKRGAYEIWTSAVSLVEVFRFADELKETKPLSAEKLQAIESMMEQPFVKLINVDLVIGRRARKIIRETPKLRKNRDAIHLASAIVWNKETLLTYDNDDLLHLNGSLKCDNGRPLAICYPDEESDGPLFAKKA